MFAGFYERHGVIDNSAMLIPLEALLAGGTSVRPVRSKVWQTPAGERHFPLARLRGLNLMLRSAKLVAECSQEDHHLEVQALLDTTAPYKPKTVFEQPMGVSANMGTPGKGIWGMDFLEASKDTPAVKDDAPVLVQPEAEAKPEIATAAGVVEAGGSSSSHASGSASGSGSGVSGYFSEFNPVNVVMDDYCVIPPGLEDWPLNKIDEWMARCNEVLKLVRGFGGGYHFSGASIKPVANSTRPSTITTAAWKDFTHKQKREAES